MKNLEIGIVVILAATLSFTVLTAAPTFSATTPKTDHFYLLQIGNSTNSGGGGYHGFAAASDPPSCSGGPVCFNGTVPGPSMTVNQGDVVNITVHNIANITHTFTITQLGVNIINAAGQTQSVQFTADMPGSFQFYCTQDDHVGFGMYGTFTVNPVAATPLNPLPLLSAAIAAVAAVVLVGRRKH